MKLLSHFDVFSKNPQTPEVSAELRQKAYEYFNANGLPTRKNEDWKYTSLKALKEEDFTPVPTTPSEVAADVTAKIQAKLNSSFINIVFHNGVFNAGLSSSLVSVAGLTFKTASARPQVIENFQDTFEALNTAFQTSHTHLEIAAKTSIAEPIQLLFYTSRTAAENAEAQIMVHPRVTLRVGAGSSATVLESYLGESTERYFVNSHVDVSVGENAKVVYVRLQADSQSAINIGRTTFDAARFANVQSLVFSTGAELSRHNLDLELKHEGISAMADGVYLVRGQQHVDNATLINHVVGGCNTSQHYKGILADRSRAVFNGKVVIGKGAQKANSAQLNNNLLLSRLAEADSKPQLEVYADDVKASHGSTVGQLNREELFYLESRAISPEVAIPMLAFGYASELIYKIENQPLQEWLNLQLKEAFAGLTLGAL